MLVHYLQAYLIYVEKPPISFIVDFLSYGIFFTLAAFKIFSQFLIIRT